MITFYGASWCGDCIRSRYLLKKHSIVYNYIDIEQHPEAVERVLQINKGMQSIPTICFDDGTMLTEPTDATLLKKLQDLQFITI